MMVTTTSGASYGYESSSVNSSNGYSYLQYFDEVYHEDKTDGSTVTPIFFKADINDYWTGPWYNRILYNPDFYEIKLYVNDLSSNYENQLFDLLDVRPAQSSHDGLDLSASVSGTGIGMSASVPKLSSFNKNMETGSYSGSYLFLGSLKMDFAQYNFYGDAHVEGVLKVMTHNDYASSNNGHRINFKVVVTLGWQAGADLSVNPWRTVTITYIIGDDIPSSTDVRLNLAIGSVTANF